MKKKQQKIVKIESRAEVKQEIVARDPRRPKPGTIMTKIYKGKTIEVKVLENGFECNKIIYPSISSLAMDIVWRNISGYVFFKLGAKSK